MTIFWSDAQINCIVLGIVIRKTISAAADNDNVKSVK